MRQRYQFTQLGKFAGKFAIITLTGIAVVLTSWFISIAYSIPASSTPVQQQAALFDQVWQTINDSFYDANFNGVDWPAMRERYKPMISQAQSREAIAHGINQMLSELKTSHTHFYTADEPAYYQLLGIFAPNNTDLLAQLKDTFPEGKIAYSGIGILTEEMEGKTFIKAILEGSPAAIAQLQVGDEILSVEGQPFHPLRSFVGQANHPLTLEVQRSPEVQQQIQVTPKQFDATQMFFDAQSASVQVIERNNQKIGYIHIWSCGSEQYQQILENELFYGRLKDADALILDLRDGWGGTPATFLNLYTGRTPSITSVFRNGKRYTHDADWKKPVVMLVNEGSRSAKEILAYGFQRYGIGKVVGSKTVGAVVAGRPFLMQDHSLLYVAYADVYVDGNTRLEGIGITPDVIVPFQLEYAQGKDPQKERAIALAIEEIGQ
ncbi:MAG: PDZ domain-containing protein [Leptolyngbyaceae cyanobacterium CRU_2_3]|nr:PDZ domain-containing protein [Leptolyngbyaceae cyanobacterium CRU_2_3]